MLLLSKNGAPVDFKIVTTGEMYTFNKSGNLILRADIEAIFGGAVVYLAQLSHVYQYSESTSGLLLNDGMHMYIVGSPRTLKWQLFQNYSLTAMDIDSKSLPRQVWFELSKDSVVIEDKVIQSGNNYTFYKFGSKILNLTVGEILDGRNADLAIVKKIYQYSETNPGIILMQNETHLFNFGGSSGIDWPLYENYTVSFMDADNKIFPSQVWIRMKKNGEIVDDKVVAINQTYSYTNPSSRLIFNARIDTIFSGNLDFLMITKAYQYSEVSDTTLISNSTKSFYPRNIEYFESLNDKFQLYENFVMIPVDIFDAGNPRQVWMRLYKNNALVDEKILSTGQNYSYYTGGRKIISTKTDTIFAGATSDMVQFRDFYQYSETNGAVLMYVQKQTLAIRTRISKNNAGITLDESKGNNLNNLVFFNNYYGILLSSNSTNNTINANNIVNNSNGVYLKYTYTYVNGSYVNLASIDNIIYHNVFLNNTRNGYDDYSTNRWDNGYFEGGNFWSDYAGIDEDKDGVGDTPYYVNSGRDSFPLIAPWNGTVRVSRTVYVDDDFVDDPSNHKWNTIQKGIADSHYSDTILVYNGTYYESVVINKQLNLIGIDTPIVNGGYNGNAITVTANNCNIDGFSFVNSNVGILLDNADSTILANNTIFDNSYGIRLSYSAPSTLRNNEIRDNTYNFDVSGWSLEDYMHDIDTSNTVNGKPIYYLVGESNRVFDSSIDAGYIGIVNSSNIIVKDLTLTNNYQGVLFAYTSNSRIENIEARNNYYGVDIQQSSSNTLINNRMANNQNGINLDSSSNNVMSGNNVSNNWIGFNIYRSPFNSLTNNIAVDNSNYGLYVYGYENGHYNNDIGTSNTINGKPVYYYYGLNNQIIQNLNSAHLTVAGSTNIVIMNNNISGGDGIHLALSDGSSIQNNVVLDNYYGIHLHSSNDIIAGNNISDNSYGIFEDGYSSNQILDNILDSNRNYNMYLSGTSGNTLTGNNISNGNGIAMQSSSGNKLTGNTINTENLGLWVDGWNAAQFNNSIDTSNTINGGSIYYYYNIHDQIIKNLDTTHLTVAGSTNITIIDNSISGGDGIILPYTNDSNITSNTVISNGQYGIYLKESYKNKIKSNSIINNDYSGVYFYQSANNELKNNTISNNNDGVYLIYSQNNTLSDNELYSNQIGIYLYYSQNNTMRHNSILGSNYGFLLYSSYNNLLYGNNLLYNNYANAYDYGSNYWNNETIGNYWDNYNGVDEDNNGIGDTPYNISGGSNQDHYPLMELYNWKMPEPKNIYVDDDFIDDPVNHEWNTINKGLGDAFYNDSIIVYNGTYNEYVRMSKQTRLIGIGMPVVNHSSIEISADKCILDGFKVISEK